MKPRGLSLWTKALTQRGGGKVERMGSGTGVASDEFSSTLRSLIGVRGLSLETIRTQLSQRGCPLSVATLSYWQSGRSRPERAASLEALTQLEVVLDVPDGFLHARLSDARSGQPPLPDAAFQAWVRDLVGEEFPAPRHAVLEIMSRLDLSLNDDLQRLRVHDVAEVRADRTAGLHRVRQVLRAERDGVDRFAVWYTPDERGAIPYVQAKTNCRLGRVYELRDISAVAAELYFDHPLRTGETVTTEHAMESMRLGIPQVQLARGLAGPAERITMEVRFHPTAFPSSAVSTFQTPEGDRTETPLKTPATTLQLDVEHPGPGFYALEWVW